MMSIAVSFSALLISTVFGVAALLDRRNAQRISREREIYQWATETLSVLPRLVNSKQGGHHLQELSIKIDTGRLLFPNTPTKDGSNKHPLNRGIRSEVLHPLVEIYNCFHRRETPDVEKLERCKKDFIYLVSRYFQPVKTDTAPKHLLQHLTDQGSR